MSIYGGAVWRVLTGSYVNPLDRLRELAQDGGMTYTADQLHAIGETIRRLREPRWKGRQFAEFVGISESHLSYIELGKRPAHPSVYQRIADQLGVPLEVLTNDHDSAGAA